MRKIKFLGVIALIAIFGFSLTTCKEPSNDLPVNQTPVASDYTVGNLAQTAGSVIAVSITANSGKSPGAISNIRYNGSTIIPQTAGTYPVTFDVAAASGWNAATGLSAGNLTISSLTGIVINLSNMNEWELTEQTAQATANVNKVFSVNGTYSTYHWHLDGTHVGTSSSYTFNNPVGVYQLVVVVTNNAGISRSGRCWVTVTAAPLTYTITYNINGGTGTTPAAQTVNVGSNVILSSGSGLTRNGFTFSGWNANTAGTGTNYNAGSSFTPTDNITLYARWNVITTRNITVLMRDSYGDGWNGGALRISVNGIDRTPNMTLSSGSSGSQTFNANIADFIQVYWVRGSYNEECAFAMYYTDNPPSPVFNPATGSSNDTTRILVNRLYGSLTNTTTGTLLGSFTVTSP